MKLLIKMIYTILISSFLFTLFIGIHPLQVSAASFSTICPGISLAPTDGIYEMLPKYDASEVLNVDRECMHNFTKKSTKQNIEPSITVLTHGLGGYPSHWSNDSQLQSIAFDSESIIEQIRYLDVANTEVFMIENGFKNKPLDSFTITKLIVNTSINSYTQDSYNLALTDLSRKIVIIFKSSDNSQHNIDDYHELDYIIDLFSYKYYLDYHFVPTVNLIGHSRGGLTNLRYLIEHPYNVDSYFSIDTPFWGSNFAQITPLMSLLGLTNTINSDGGSDILNVTLQTELYNDFIALGDTKNHINFHAIGSVITIEGLFDIVLRMMFDVIRSIIDPSLVDQVRDLYPIADYIPLNYFINYHTDQEWRTSFVITAYEFAIDIVEYFYPELVDEAYDLLESIPYLSLINNFSSTSGDYLDADNVFPNNQTLCDTLLLDDVFIHLASQLGKNGNQDYGFTTFVKVYSSNDNMLLDGHKSFINAAAVPHNLVAQDPDVIDYILNQINYDAFKFTPSSSGTMKLMGVTAKFDSIRVPSKDAEGNVVTSIEETAFSNNSHLTDIHLPATITSVHEKAFLDLPHLKSITVDPDNPVYKSVNGMLINKNTDTLIHYPAMLIPPENGLIIPDGVTTIGRYAFKDNENIASIHLNEVETIQTRAFENSRVTTIEGNGTLTKVETDALLNTPLFASSIVIIDQNLVKYAEAPVNGIVNLQSAAIKYISENAFEANPSLVELRLPVSTLRIDNYGLANLVNLKRLYIPSLVDVRLSSNSLSNLNGSLTIYTSSNAALTSEKLTPDIFTNITIVETTDTNIVDKVSRWVYIQPYSNAYIYPTPLNGYVFEYWAEVTPDNIIPVTDQNGFVTDLAYQFEGTLVAFYSPLVYEMNLTVDGVLLESFHYTIESSTSLPVAYKTQSVFVGWNCAGQLIVSIVPGRTGNYDCSAVFNPTTLYAITTPGSYTVVAANATVNLVNSISSTQSLTLTIASSTNYVEVKGVAYQIYNNTKIIISTRTAPLTMVFNNLILLAPVGNTLMTNSSFSPTYITTYGYVYLKGGDGSLSSVSNGLDGKPAISMTGPLYVYTYKGSLSLIGGNGSTGITGQLGTNGVDGVNGTLFANGTNGSDGSNGQTGQQGGDGAVAVSTSIFTVKSFNSTIHLIGGSGGRGGMGGSGGHGGDGGDGYSNWLYSTSAGHGGDGGNGGQGGLGGLGANPMVAPQGCYLIDATGSTFIVQEGTTGLTGLVGYKGLGGDGGDGTIPGLDGNDGSGR